MSWAQVRREFEQHGINGEVPIAEYTSFLLLLKGDWPTLQGKSGTELQPEIEQRHAALQTQYPNLRIPQFPPTIQWGTQTLDRLLELLSEETPRSLNLGLIFQEEVRFELLRGQGGSQYPTPHHIADFMASLVVTVSEDPHIFDPTAGSGGLLAAAKKQNSAVRLAGCDFDPQWAGIGSANLLLHGASNASYRVGSALVYRDALTTSFDGLLMNPPFGGERGREEVESGLDTTAYGFGTANVLGALAVRVLRPGGMAAFLSPSGLLYKKGGEARLRSLLLENKLEAIVTLPPDALQPHNTNRAHLVLVQKRLDEQHLPTADVWLCVLNHDGYSSGSSRSLSSETVNNARNELPRTRDLLIQHRQDRWQTGIEAANGLQIQTLHLAPGTGEATLPGRAFRIVLPEAQQTHTWSAAHLPSGLLLAAPTTDEADTWLYALYNSPTTYQLRPDQTYEVGWDVKLPAADPPASLPERWQGDGDDVILTIDRSNQMLLRKGTSRTQRFEFNSRKQGDTKACLLQQNGNPLTPWWRMGRGESLPDDFADKFAAMPLFDGENQRAGWLLALTTEEANDDLATGWLVIAEAENIRPFAPNGQDGPHFLRLENGLWEIGQQEPELGREVSFGRAADHPGFAIGPAPDSEGQTYAFFGVLVSHNNLGKAGREQQKGEGYQYEVETLDPTQFLPEPPPPPTPQPAKVLADVRRNQARLSTRIDNLLRVLGSDSALPGAVGRPAAPPPTLLAPLNRRQLQLWQILETHIEDDRPLHFHLDDVLSWCAENQMALAADEVQQQIILFSRMGLIMEVNSLGHNWYRLVTVSDIAAEANP